MTDADKDRLLDLLRTHAGQLSEHFETVQILATVHDPVQSDGTISFHFGQGNWFARYGQIRKWIQEQDQHKPENT